MLFQFLLDNISISFNIKKVLNNVFLLDSVELEDKKTRKSGKKYMDNEEFVVDTPWGKLVTAAGLEILLTGFQNDIDKLTNTLSRIEARLNEIESSLSSHKNVNSRVQAFEGSLKSLEDEIQEFRDNQSRFAAHMKKTLELLYSRFET